MKIIKKIYIIIFLCIGLVFIQGKVMATNSANSFYDSKDVTVSKIITQSFSSYSYLKKCTTVQSFCTDGKFFYVACVTSRSKADKRGEDVNGNKVIKYSSQETTIIKINMKTKKVVAHAYLGKIGHVNSLAYNSKTNTIIITPCCDVYDYLLKMPANFQTNSQPTINSKLEKIYLKKKNEQFSNQNNYLRSYNKETKQWKVKGIASVAYNEGRDEYLMKINNHMLAIFDSNFVFKRNLTIKDNDSNRTIEENKFSLRGFNQNNTSQSIYADCAYIYSVYNVFFKNDKDELQYIRNYILIFDYNGNYIKTIEFYDNAKINDIELEEIYYCNGRFYAVGNNKKITEDNYSKSGCFSIFQINIKNPEMFDIAFLNVNAHENKYQSIKYINTCNKKIETTKISVLQQSVNSNNQLGNTNNVINKTQLMETNFMFDTKKLIGFKAYRDYNNTWLVNVNGVGKWLTSKEIKSSKNKGQSVEFKLYKTVSSVYHTVKGGNSVLLIAQWK